MAECWEKVVDLGRGGESYGGGKLFENDMFFSKELGVAKDYRS